MKKKVARIGIFAGVFDPVHAGHIGFALQAAVEAKLDEVYFLPERNPRFKPGAAHYGHRVAMLNTALKPHGSLGFLEVVDRQFTVNRTLPQLLKTFSGSDLTFLMGTDAFASLPSWANATRLTDQVRITVGIRNSDELRLVNATIATLGLSGSKVSVVDSDRPGVSSSNIRNALRRNSSTIGLLPSVARYARREWLYVHVPHTKTA